MRWAKLAAVLVLVIAVAVLASACGSGGATTNGATTMASSDITKPKPAVTVVNASTAGLFEDYNAIVDVTVTNEGADGVVVVVASITQAGVTDKSEMPVYLAHNGTQTVKLVFPLKWKGGDWTPAVTTEIP